MKKIEMITMSLLLGFFLVLGANAYAQDMTKSTPGVTSKVLVDNEKVKVTEVEFAPGAVSDWHSHPNYVIYALTDAKMELTEKGKAAYIKELKAGTASYMPAVTHMAKNIGTTAAKMVLTELKPATKKMNSKKAPTGKK